METILKEIAAAIRSIASGFDQWLNGSVITRTSFTNVDLNAPMVKGIPIGSGKCKAVRLKLNRFIIGTANDQQSTSLGARVYFGDARQQTAEIPYYTNQDRNFNYCEWTPKIYCTDLEEVFLFAPNYDQAETLTVQAMIYH